jgi:hypothetical protein
MTAAGSLAISPALRDALAQWLDHLRALDGAEPKALLPFLA